MFKVYSSGVRPNLRIGSTIVLVFYKEIYWLIDCGPPNLCMCTEKTSQ